MTWVRAPVGQGVPVNGPTVKMSGFSGAKELPGSARCWKSNAAPSPRPPRKRADRSASAGSRRAEPVERSTQALCDIFPNVDSSLISALADDRIHDHLDSIGIGDRKGAVAPGLVGKFPPDGQSLFLDAPILFIHVVHLVGQFPSL